MFTLIIKCWKDCRLALLELIKGHLSLSWARMVMEDFLKEVTFRQRSEAKCEGKELQAEGMAYAKALRPVCVFCVCMCVCVMN